MFIYVQLTKVSSCKKKNLPKLAIMTVDRRCPVRAHQVAVLQHTTTQPS